MPEAAHVSERELTISAVLLLVSDTPAGGTAVLVSSPDAPTFVVLGDDTEEGFVRLRAGAIAFGTPETYRAVPRDTVRDDGRLLNVRPERFRLAEVDRTGSLFGIEGSPLWIPVGQDARPVDRIAVPLPSLEHPLYATFRRSARSDDSDGLTIPFRYELDGEATEREGYICQHCGRLCAVKEPHTAAHGVAGHTRAGGSGQDFEPGQTHPRTGEISTYEPHA